MKRSLSQNSLEIFKKARIDNLFCDAVLKTEDGGYFNVHKCILMTCSSYFNTMFTNTTYGDSGNTFMIPGITKRVLSSVIDYAYIHKIKLDFNTVAEILSAADQFNIIGLINECSHFLMENIDANNCINIQEIAERFCLTELNIKCCRYIRTNFEEIVEKSQELMEVSASELATILSSDELNVKAEEIVWETAIRWVEVDEENRKEHVPELMKCVRLGLVNANYFMDKIRNHRYVVENNECLQLTAEALRLTSSLEILAEEDQLLNPNLICPRIPNEVIFCIGGWKSHRAINCVETYDIRGDHWVIMDETHLDRQRRRAYHGCVVLKDEIYVIGGYNGEVYFNNCCCFNVVTKQWRDIGSMHCKRSYISVAVLDDVIYAMGGYDGIGRLNTAEVYKHTRNQWTTIAAMDLQRSAASATVYNGCVYITGGFTGTEWLQSVECYYPSLDQWTLIPPMRNRRSGMCCVTYKDCIYVLGGFNGRERVELVEKYNVRNGTWRDVPNMLTQRSNFASAVIDDKIFVIGGYDGDNVIGEVEYYSETSNEWRRVNDMNISRFAFVACVVGGIPNIKDYVNEDRYQIGMEKRRHHV